MLGAGQILVWACLYYFFPAMLIYWEQHLSWSKSDLTGAISMSICIMAVGAPFVGRLIDAGHGRLMMPAAAVIGGACLMGLSQITSLWQFYVLWVLIGASMSACLYEPCFAIVTRARAHGATSGIVAISLIAGFASAISFPSANLLVAALGWRMTAVLSGSVVIVLAAPLLWFGVKLIERSATAAVQVIPSDQIRKLRLSRNAGFWALALSFACLALVHGGVLQHLLPMLTERGVATSSAVLVASLVGPMQVVGRVALSATAKHISPLTLTFATFGFMALSVIVLKTANTNMVSLIIFVAIFGASYGTVSILRPVVARLILGPENFGQKSGALALPYLAAVAASPLAGSVIWAYGGYDLMLSMLVFLALAGGVLFLFAHRQ
jgi:MFS family permease